MSGEKKKRQPNFSNTERSVLLQIIGNKYCDVLEDKKTNRACSTNKAMAWRSIENDFNASATTNVYRSANTLRKCYENRKKELRKSLAEERKETLLTGGGPPAKMMKTNATDEILLSIMNKKILVGLQNPFDDDADMSAIEIVERTADIEYYIEAPEPEVVGKIVNTTSPSTITANNEVNENSQTPLNWRKYTPHQLQTPVSAKLLTKEDSGQNEVEFEKMNKTPKKSNSRRRPATIVKPLTSSDIAKKYDLLLDKRLQLSNAQLQHIETSNMLSIKKQKLEIEMLELELANKKQLNCT